MDKSEYIPETGETSVQPDAAASYNSAEAGKAEHNSKPADTVADSVGAKVASENSSAAPAVQPAVFDDADKFYPDAPPFFSETLKNTDVKSAAAAIESRTDEASLSSVSDAKAVSNDGGAADTLEVRSAKISDNVANTSVKAESAETPAAAHREQGTECPADGREQSAENAADNGLPPAPHLSDREVMEHTAYIWRYQSIIDDGTEQHSEYHEKHTSAPFAEIIGARVRGKKHKHEGTNCDDFFETAVTDDCIICVVCDGAGSKPLSRIGSRVCSETAASYLKEQLPAAFAETPEIKTMLCSDMGAPEFMEGCGKIAALVQQSAREAFAAQQKVLAEVSADKKYTDVLGRQPMLSDFSTTFLAAVIVPLEINGGVQALTVSVQIGDGCICTIDSKADSAHCLRLMGEADSGAFSGETDFISEKNTRPEVISGKTRVGRSAADIVLLMTDGVADDYFPAQPMMKRLYLDLCLNGILPMAGELSAGEDPAPIRYRSVSMSQQSVALQYAKQLLSDSSPEAMNGLWDKREVLRCHSLEAFRMNIGDTPEERLRVWLDNYNERGSFDDRTLAAVRLHAADE